MNKKALAIFLASMMSIGATSGVFADEIVGDGTIDEIQGDIMLISENEENAPVAEEPEYIYFNAVVTSVSEDQSQISTEVNGVETVFNITEDTLFLAKTKSAIMEGDTLAIAVDTSVPATLQLPATYTAFAIARTEGTIYIGEFSKDLESEYLINEAGDLMLSTGETGYTAQDIEGKKIAVVYSASTRSLPPIAMADMIYVINEDSSAADKDKENAVNDCITIIANGIAIDFSKYDNVLPVIENDFTLVPLRAIAEALGCEVSYDDTQKLVTVKNGDKTIELVLNSNCACVDGVDKELGTSAKVVNGRTLIPLRFVSQEFGHEVDWDGNTLTATIK